MSEPVPMHGVDAAATPSVVYLIGRVDQGIRREMRKRLREWQLSVPDYTTLAVLSARPGLSNAQLSRRALITPQSMIQVLSNLEDRGLVQRDLGPGHGRILRAQLTETGRDVLRAAAPAVSAIQEALFADLPEWQRSMILQILIDAMHKLTTGLEA